MTKFKIPGLAYIAVLPLLGLAFLSAVVAAQAEKVEGLITARNGDQMIVKTSTSPNLVVLLTDSTDVDQVKGLLKARKKEMSMAALIPGLAVKVEGTYNDQQQLVAEKIRFKGSDLQRAQAIQAGMHETNEKVAQNQADINAQGQALEKNQSATAENKAALAAATARFGQMDDYYILDQATVYFPNGKSDLDPKYNDQLTALADKAKTIQGYMVEVKGYASVTGSAASNQKLSEDRASNVVAYLIQQCHVPLTRMLAPGAMGESEQVGGNANSTEGQAENRRVVVRVLQNKAVAGT